MKKITSKSMSGLERVFQPMFAGSSAWHWNPTITRCCPFPGQNHEFSLQGVGEDERIVAALFRDKDGGEVIISLATNTERHGAPRHAKFLPFLSRPGAAWWDPTLTVTVAEV